MKNKLLILACSALLFSCTSVKREVRRIDNVKFTVLSDSIYTHMPGELYCTNDYIVWVDPFSASGLIHFLDAKTGKELMTWGNIGNGPKEFTAIKAALSYPPFLYVFDLNKKLQALLNLKTLSVENPDKSIKWRNDSLMDFTKRLQLSENTFVSLSPGGTYPFVLDNNDVVDSVGHFPISDKISNGFNVFQGNILYNAERKCLVYSTTLFPYTAMYRFDKGQLSLEWEKLDKIVYEVNKDLFVLDKTNKHGFHATALTKNYIVGSCRDEEVEGTLPKGLPGRDLKRLPHSLFVYDYKFNLCKIINLKLPILRLAGNVVSDDLCAIIANPEFEIIKLSL